MKLQTAAVAFAFLIIPATRGAGQTDEAREKPSATASLIPVGAGSDSYWEGDGAGMRAIPLDPGAAPPATLTVRERDGWKTIPTVLNRPTPALPVRAGMLRVFAGAQAGPEGEPPLFAEFKLPASAGHYDIFLNREPKRDDWDKAEAMILPASITAFPEGSFRLVNLSTMRLKWKIANRTGDLAPRGNIVVKPPTEAIDRTVSVQAAHAQGESYRLVIRTGMKLAADQRINMVVYPGRNPNKPCEITWYYQNEPNSESTKEK